MKCRRVVCTYKYDPILLDKMFLMKWQVTYGSLEKENKGAVKQKVIFTKGKKVWKTIKSIREGRKLWRSFRE